MNKEKLKSCLWIEDNDGNWDTSCGEYFTLNEGTPKENGMKYCCYCGKRLEEQKESR